jgi:hypothetical protein
MWKFFQLVGLLVLIHVGLSAVCYNTVDPHTGSGFRSTWLFGLGEKAGDVKSTDLPYVRPLESFLTDEELKEYREGRCLRSNYDSGIALAVFVNILALGVLFVLFMAALISAIDQ